MVHATSIHNQNKFCGCKEKKKANKGQWCTVHENGEKAKRKPNQGLRAQSWFLLRSAEPAKNDAILIRERADKDRGAHRRVLSLCPQDSFIYVCMERRGRKPCQGRLQKWIIDTSRALLDRDDPTLVEQRALLQ
jgi:hypothetical protein